MVDTFSAFRDSPSSRYTPVESRIVSMMYTAVFVWSSFTTTSKNDGPVNLKLRRAGSDFDERSARGAPTVSARAEGRDVLPLTLPVGRDEEGALSEAEVSSFLNAGKTEEVDIGRGQEVDTPYAIVLNLSLSCSGCEHYAT